MLAQNPVSLFMFAHVHSVNVRVLIETWREAESFSKKRTMCVLEEARLLKHTAELKSFLFNANLGEINIFWRLKTYLNVRNAIDVMNALEYNKLMLSKIITKEAIKDTIKGIVLKKQFLRNIQINNKNNKNNK